MTHKTTPLYYGSPKRRRITFSFLFSRDLNIFILFTEMVEHRRKNTRYSPFDLTNKQLIPAFRHNFLLFFIVHLRLWRYFNYKCREHIIVTREGIHARALISPDFFHSLSQIFFFLIVNRY